MNIEKVVSIIKNNIGNYYKNVVIPINLDDNNNIRIVRSEQLMTADFNPDRINVYLSNTEKIIAVSVG